MKFLIIDDDLESADFLGTIIEKSGNNVIKGYTAGEGLELFNKSKPDAVFLDIMLPDKNGIELLKELKKIDKETTVIMVTGFKDAENVVSAFREGAFDCLLKPFNVEYLKNDILSRIQSRNR